MQGPFSIALSGAAEDREIRGLARDHFGGMPERIMVEDTEAALRAVIAGEVTLAVLPWGDRTLGWLGHLLAETESGLPDLFRDALRSGRIPALPPPPSRWDGWNPSPPRAIAACSALPMPAGRSI